MFSKEPTQKTINIQLTQSLFPIFCSRKVVVLEKKEEETFGFEIQVRGLVGGGDLWISWVSFNRISLVPRVHINAD